MLCVLLKLIEEEQDGSSVRSTDQWMLECQEFTHRLTSGERGASEYDRDMINDNGINNCFSNLLTCLIATCGFVVEKDTVRKSM